jgi:hypothetical protein
MESKVLNFVQFQLVKGKEKVILRAPYFPGD